MPKHKAKKSTTLRGYVAEFPDCFTTDGQVLFCKKCGVKVSGDRRSSVTQHLHSAKHKRLHAQSATSSTAAPTQQLLTAIAGYDVCQFYSDLAEMLVGTDIPFNKISNKKLRDFFASYCKYQLPDESTLRKNYLPKIYEEKMTVVRNKLSGKYVWVSIDETTDSLGRYVVNVVAGALTEDQEVHLIDVKYVKETNHATLGKVLIDALNDALGGESLNRVLLLLTDSAPYMHKMAGGISALLPSCLHITCLAHALHRIAETVRAAYPDVDALISAGKKAFLKAPGRRSLYSTMLPDTPLPPQPVITRWGTWLAAAAHYADQYDATRTVVDRLDPEDSAAVKTLQNLFTEKQNLKIHLAFIKANYVFLMDTIKKLESRSLLAASAWKLFCDMCDRLREDSVLKKKVESVVQRNKGLAALFTVLNAITPGGVPKPQQLRTMANSEFVESLEPSGMASFKYAPLTSVAVERTFSAYKSVLKENRHNFTEETLKKYMVVYFN